MQDGMKKHAEANMRSGCVLLSQILKKFAKMENNNILLTF